MMSATFEENCANKRVYMIYIYIYLYICINHYTTINQSRDWISTTWSDSISDISFKKMYSRFQNQETPFPSYLSFLAGQSDALSCLVSSCLVWPKINHSWPCVWLCAKLVVIGLHNVIEEYCICIYVQGLKWTFIFVRRRKYSCWKLPNTQTKTGKTGQDETTSRKCMYIHIHTQNRLFIRKSQHFKIQQQPTSRHGSNFRWKIFHNKEFRDFVPGCSVSIQVTFLKSLAF